MPQFAPKTTTRADKVWRRMRGVFCWGPRCLIKLLGIVAAGALFLIMCYAAIWYCWKRKWRPAAAPPSRPRRRDSSSRPGSPKTVRFDSSQTWPQQQQPPRKSEPPPRPPSPAVKRKAPEIPPPPPLPSQPPWSS